MNKSSNLNFNCTDFYNFKLVSPTDDEILNISLRERSGLNHPVMPLKRLETHSVDGLTIKTDYKAKGDKNNEISTLIVVSKQNGEILNTFYQAIFADEEHFSYDSDTKTITLPNDNGIAVIPNDTEVMYSYIREQDIKKT